MKNLALFIIAILLYCGNVSAQSTPQNTSDSRLTISPIEVYSNPVQQCVRADIHDIVFNRSIQSLNATIYTMDGRQVYAEKLKATSVVTLSTQDLPKGSYILHLGTDDGRTFTGEFVKL